MDEKRKYKLLLKVTEVVLTRFDWFPDSKQIENVQISASSND